MTENKRFKIGGNVLGMKFILYDGKHILMGTFAYTDGLKEVVDLLNEQDNKIKELMNELELYKYYVEFVPSSGDVE